MFYRILFAALIFVLTNLSASAQFAQPTPPAGGDRQVQYNKLGVFGADPNLLWNYTTQTLTTGVTGNGFQGTGTINSDYFTAFSAASGSGLSGDPVTILGGTDDPIASPITTFGGNLNLGAGGSVTGTGGSIYLSPGASLAGLAHYGNVVISYLPTTDPVVSGALWSSNDQVVVSGFTPSGGNTVTLTADTDIAAGTAVSIDASGGAVQTFAAAPSIANTATLLTGAIGGGSTVNVPAVLSLSPTQFVAFQSSAAPGGNFYNGPGAVAFSLAGTVITVGTPSTAGGLQNANSMAALDPATFIYSYTDSSFNLWIQVGSISGNVITLGTAVEVATSVGGTAGQGYPLPQFAVLSATSFVFVYQDSTAQNWIVAGSISGTTITLGVAVATITSGLVQPATITSTTAAIAFIDASHELNAAVVTVAGTVAVIGTATTLATPTVASDAMTIVGIDGTRFCVTFGDGDAFGAPATPLTFSAVVGVISAGLVTFGTVAAVLPNNWNINYVAPATVLSPTELAFYVGTTEPTLATLSDSTLTLTLGATLPVISNLNPSVGYPPNSNVSFSFWSFFFPQMVAVGSTQLMFLDPQWSLYEETTAGLVSQPIIHPGIAEYGFAPISSTQALALLVDNANNLLARVLTFEPINAGPVGFAASACTATASCTVTLSGSVSGFSGLTAGTQYFVNGDGTMTPGNTGKPAGVALTSSSLLIKGN